MRPSGFRLRFSASSIGITTTAAPPSTMPLALPAVTMPFLLKRGLQLAQTVHGRVRAQMVVFGKHFTRGSPRAIAQRHRGYLFLEPAGLVGVIGALLRAQRELVQHLAGDVLLLGVKLGGVRHIKAAVAVQQRDHQRVFQFAFAQADSPSACRESHAAPGYIDSMPPASTVFGLAELDHLRRRYHRLHARSAEAVDGERRNFDRHAGFQRDVARAVNGVARGLLRVAHHAVIDFTRLDAGALHGLDGSDGTQLLAREIS